MTNKQKEIIKDKISDLIIYGVSLYFFAITFLYIAGLIG